MTDTRKRLIEKIKALQAHTTERGCTEEEAMTAAVMASRLISEHQLSMTEIEIGEEICEFDFLSTGERTPHEVRFCVIAVAKYTDTKIWTTRRKEFTLAFFGLPEDVVFAVFLIKIIQSAMLTETNAYHVRMHQLGERWSRAAGNAFMRGMATRISGRLTAMRRDKEADRATSTGRDLMVVKNALVKEQFDRLGLNLVYGRAGVAKDQGSFDAGKAAGDRVGLNRPIGGRGGGYMLGN